MIVRPYSDADLGAILGLHRKQDLDYELPELDRMAASVLIEEGGTVTHALFLRPTLEAYWVFDPVRWWKREALARLLVLHHEGDIAAAEAGFDDVHCWLPPQVTDKKLHSTMIKLGWDKPQWPCYHRPVAPVRVEV